MLTDGHPAQLSWEKLPSTVDKNKHIHSKLEKMDTNSEGLWQNKHGLHSSQPIEAAVLRKKETWAPIPNPEAVSNQEPLIKEN